MANTSSLIKISILFTLLTVVIAGCSNGGCKVTDKCSSDKDCATGLQCFGCLLERKKCVRTSVTDQFKLVNNSLPFNKYSFLTTHKSFASENAPVYTPRIKLSHTQEDNVTMQLRNGVRGLMLDVYDFNDTVWLCDSGKEKCGLTNAYEPLVNTLKEVQAFLSGNPSEIVTIILQDYVNASKGLSKVFEEAGLKKFWFPVEKMPKSGDWPIVKNMVADNQRLLVFTSRASKQQTEGIAYIWNFFVGNANGHGLHNCVKDNKSAQLSNITRSLVLVKNFRTIFEKINVCKDNSKKLKDVLQTCYNASGNRWANFVAVNYYKRSEGGGAFRAVDALNGKLICGANDVHECVKGFVSPSGSNHTKGNDTRISVGCKHHWSIGTHTFAFFVSILIFVFGKN